MGCNNPTSTPMFGCCGEGGGLDFLRVQVVSVRGDGQAPFPFSHTDLNSIMVPFLSDLDGLPYPDFDPGDITSNLIHREVVVHINNWGAGDYVGVSDTVTTPFCGNNDLVGPVAGWSTTSSSVICRKLRLTPPGLRGFCISRYESGAAASTVLSPCGAMVLERDGPISPTYSTASAPFEILPPTFVPWILTLQSGGQHNKYTISADTSAPPPCNQAP